MAVNYEYPVLVGAPDNPLNPYHNGVMLLKFAELSTIEDEISYWNCNDSAYLECTDSTEVAGPPGDYDFMYVDTTYWNCNDGAFPNCFDSTEVIDTTGGYEFVHMDTSYWDCNAGTSPYCIDSTKVSDPGSGYEFSHIDSFFNVYAAFDPTFKQPWGVNVIYQLDNYLDSVEVETFLLPGELVHLLNIPGYKDYRTITMIFSPASEVRDNYSASLPIDFAYYCPDENSINPEYVSLSAAVLTPYPNPAVVSEMENDSVYFRFQMPTNTTGFPDHCSDSTKVYDITAGYDFISRDTSYWICNAGTYPFCTDSTEVFEPNDDYDFIHVVTSYWNCNVAYAERIGINMVVDIFNIAGERVAEISSDEASYYQGNYFHGDRVFGWNLKNQHGENVASGVYLAFARAYSAEKNGYLIAEAMAKIALIR